MVGSVAIDLAIGMSFLFLAVSLFASAATEAVASVLKIRHDTLLDGLKQMLNAQTGQSAELLTSLYNHGLIAPLGDGTAKRVEDIKNKPAYIETKGFASAFVDVLQNLPEVQNDIASAVDKIENPQLKNTLLTLLTRAGHDRQNFENAVGQWFDSGMNRVSGFYKRWTQWVSAAFALGAALIFKLDAIQVFTSIWKRPSITANLGSVESFTQAMQQLSTLGYPIGWTRGFEFGSIVLGVLGCLMTATAALFGAPFWFDTLQRLVQLRGNGRAVGTIGTHNAADRQV